MTEKNNFKKRENLESLLNKAKRHKIVSSSDINNDEITTTKENEKPCSFTFIGKKAPVETAKVKHYLPKWLANPILIPSDLKTLTCKITDIQLLDKTLVQNLQDEGITHFFPVQEKVLPWMLKDIVKTRITLAPSHNKPRDICVSAPTGSGKTLAYALPIIQSLSKRTIPKIRAVIIAPSHELVIQIANVFKLYCKGTSLVVYAAVGGRTPLTVEQKNLVKADCCFPGTYKSLVDIFVTTAGRLVDHLDTTNGFDLSCLRYLVLDEADRMIDLPQDDWLYRLEKHFTSLGFNAVEKLSVQFIDKQKFRPQMLLFSATLSLEPEVLKKLNLFEPVLFSTVSNSQIDIEGDKTEEYITSVTTPLELKEKYMIVEPVSKPMVICNLFERGWRYILCFTKSGNDAHKLSKLLSFMNPSLNIKELSAMLAVNERDSILSDFCLGLIDMLVCSDVMTRGIDVHHVQYVISYDAPKFIQTYIHRVGRTGRAGCKGTALTFVSPSQVDVFKQMLHDSNKNDVKQIALSEEELNIWKNKYRESLQKLKHFLEDEQSRKTKAIKIEKRPDGKKSKQKKKKNKKKKKLSP